MKRKAYDALMEPMQRELVAVARWARLHGERIVVVMEGRDTAGKGGSIKAITEHLDTRQFRVVALPKPSEREQGQWYFQRYIEHLPTRGEIVLFDRSWYNRAGVERVMGFATAPQVDTFLRETPLFERSLASDGIRLLKYWLCCDQAQQEERFAERRNDPLKAWKLSPIDVEARARYHGYTDAREAMLAATHTQHAPWTLVDFNDQRTGRLTLVRHLLDQFPEAAQAHETPLAPEFPPLPRKPRRERYTVLQPLAPMAGDDGEQGKNGDKDD